MNNKIKKNLCDKGAQVQMVFLNFCRELKGDEKKKLRLRFFTKKRC